MMHPPCYVCGLLVLSLLLPGCISQQGLADGSPPEQLVSSGQQSGLYDIGGYRLYLECAGQGSPTLVLDHGQGESGATWFGIWSELTTISRVCRYDRAGRGESEQGPVPTTSAQMVDQLSRLLVAANVQPPYLLVGHSLGGMNVQLFAHTFSKEVVGLVLLDSSSPDYTPDNDLLRFAEERMADGPAGQEVLQEFIRYFRDAMADHTTSPEGVDWERSYRELAPVSEFGDLPLYVITASDRTWTSPPSLPVEVRQFLAQRWLEAQQGLAARSRRSTHVIAEGAGHYVHIARPDAVTAAIHEVLQMSRQSAEAPKE